MDASPPFAKNIDFPKTGRLLLEYIQTLIKLTSMQMVLCAGVVFIAGMVRGFSGFALSALIMASVALIIPPIELIPVCYILEAVASLIMFRGGVRDADMKVVWGLSIGLVIGFPMGLYATNVLPVEASKFVVLCIILTLAIAQLLRASPKGSTRTSGLYATGVIAGIVTGLAHVGGMVVALYVLARESPARTMRSSLVMFLFIGMFTELLYLLGFGVLNRLAITRGLMLTPVVAGGVLVGMFLFRPSLVGAYKKLCLGLLIFLSMVGLLRLVL
jgi:uncharacterized membrane protein YfcA